MKTITYTLLVCLFLFNTGQKQAIAQIDEDFEVHKRLDIKGSLSPLTFDFNIEDFFWSISGGIDEKNYRFSVRANIEFRPFYKKIQVIEPNAIVRQYHEKKYLFSIDVEKRFFDFDLFNKHTNLFVGSRNGLLTGNYKGTKDDLDAKCIIAPMMGLAFALDDNMLFKVGYIYLNDGLVNVPNHRVTLGFNITL